MSSDVEVKLRRSEEQLLRLAKTLDQPVEEIWFKLAVLSLAQRTRTLERALRQVAYGRNAAVAGALLRPMVEINLLIRFLERDPELHTELWQAEGERNVLTITEEITQSPHMRERWAEFIEDMDLSGFEERRKEVAKWRAEAVAAGKPWVGEKKGELVPSIAKLVRFLDEPAAFEVYTMGYRVLCWDVHAGARSMLHGNYREVAPGMVTYTDLPDSTTGVRVFGVATFASTLKLASAHLGLGIEADADAVQREWVPQSPEQPGRLV